MALEPATIAVTWDSQYAGEHRVCFRIVGAPTYTCTTAATHPSCPGAGAPCGYDIAITVDNETCTTINYEGYVQPTCFAEIDIAGRIPFAVSFVPDPACNLYEVTCDDSGVADPGTVVGPGDGYLAPPAVTLSGGGGAGATATAALGAGILAAVDSFTPGAGYGAGNASSTQIGIPLLRAGQVATTGVGATVDVTFDGAALITAIVLNAPGSGYDTADDLAPMTIDTSALTDTTVPGAEATVDVSATDAFADQVASITVTAPGSGYTSAPAVTIDPPGAGTTATGSVSLIGCTALTVTDCSGVSAVVHPLGTLQPGETISLCGTTPPSVPADYSVVEDNNGNCLCTCQDVDLSSAGGDTTVRYIDCNDVAVETVILDGAPAVNTCLVVDSLSFVEDPGATFTLVVNSTCDGV